MAGRVPALLGGDAPRSEHDPDLEAAATAITAMHPVKGAFADPNHELAFAAHIFRVSFGGHVLLMAVQVAYLFWDTLWMAPTVRPLGTTWTLLALIALIGRVLIHRMEDTVRGQRMGSWTWTVYLVVSVLLDVRWYVVHSADVCQQDVNIRPNMHALYISYHLYAFGSALVNGSHGLGFAHKTGLVGALLLDFCVLPIIFCGSPPIIWCAISAVMIIVASALAHLAEIHLRYSYVDKQRLEEEKRRLEARLDEESEEGRRLEERLEQLRAEKERLMYDVQRRGRPLDDGDDRSAIRRGLQAGPSQPCPRADSTDSSKTSSERGVPAPSDSPPPSLPPGPPSTKSSHSSEPISIAGKSTAPPPPTLAHPSSLARGPVSELVAGQVADVLLTEVLADKEVLVELQILLHSATETSSGGRPSPEPNQGSQGPLPAQTNSSVVPSVTVAQQQRAIPHRMQDTVTVDSTLQVQRDVREMLASYSPVVPSCNVHEPPGSLGGQSNMSTGQQALHVARHRMHAASVEVEAHRAIRTLAIALGASRTEGGTIKALQAVLLQLEQPGMSCDEARTATGASMSNFMKWKRRVHQARLN